jgi:hypothetical protein
MGKTLTGPLFSANVRTKGGGTVFVTTGGILGGVAELPGDLADGELERLAALGAFAPEDPTEAQVRAIAHGHTGPPPAVTAGVAADQVPEVSKGAVQREPDVIRAELEERAKAKAKAKAKAAEVPEPDAEEPAPEPEPEPAKQRASRK